MKVDSSSESHHISAQNKEKHVLSTFQNFLREHAPRPLQQGHTCSVTKKIYTIEDLTLCKQINLRALVMPKYKAKQTASSLLINMGSILNIFLPQFNKNMQLDYLFTNCIKSSKFSEVIFKKHNLKVYANYVQCNFMPCYQTVV